MISILDHLIGSIGYDEQPGGSLLLPVRVATVVKNAHPRCRHLLPLPPCVHDLLAEDRRGATAATGRASGAHEQHPAVPPEGAGGSTAERSRERDEDEKHSREGHQALSTNEDAGGARFGERRGRGPIGDRRRQ